MRTWLGSLVFVVFGTLVAVPGCSGDPQVNGDHDAINGGTDGAGGTHNGTGNNGNGASSGSLVIGDGGNEATDGCPSSCEALNANCGFVTDERCGGVVQ